MQIDKDLLTHYLYVSLQDRERRGDEKETKRRGERMVTIGRRGEERRGERMVTRGRREKRRQDDDEGERRTLCKLTRIFNPLSPCFITGDTEW